MTDVEFTHLVLVLVNAIHKVTLHMAWHILNEYLVHLIFVTCVQLLYMTQVSVLYFCFSTLIIIFLFANYVIIV